MSLVSEPLNRFRVHPEFDLLASFVPSFSFTQFLEPFYLIEIMNHNPAAIN